MTPTFIFSPRGRHGVVDFAIVPLNRLRPALMIGALVSQAIGRKMNRRNFYDVLLAQDGHRLEHVRPPRDLHSWQQLPVSAIANFAPVVLPELGTPAVRRTLETHPYRQFPVIRQGKLLGLLTRKEAETALAQQREPVLAPATTCLREQTVAQLQRQLIESETQIVLILDGEEGAVVGLVTLHDILRAQSAMAHAAKEEV